MPLNVRLKLILIFACVSAMLIAAWMVSPLLSAALILAALFIIEMIYPKWNFFGPCMLDVRDREKAVAITFDDGPSEWTLPILETLKDQNVRATFFLLGKNVERYPAIAKKIQDEGHALGLHGYAHTKYIWKSRSFIAGDLDACMRAFEKAGLVIPKLVRFPHGFKNIFAVGEVRRRTLILCGWGRGVWDSKKPGIPSIVARSLELKAGEILLLHDGDGANEKADRSQTAEALPAIIEGLRQKGYEFVTL
jgi:peptidoglycan/xylan/chitin deacetylase (PgdA/CDA1 family)